MLQRSILQILFQRNRLNVGNTLTDYVESILKILVSLSTESIGVLTGTLIPPAIAIVSCLLEALFTTGRQVCVCYAEQGNKAKTLQLFK